MYLSINFWLFLISFFKNVIYFKIYFLLIFLHLFIYCISFFYFFIYGISSTNYSFKMNHVTDQTHRIERQWIQKFFIDTTSLLLSIPLSHHFLQYYLQFLLFQKEIYMCSLCMLCTDLLIVCWAVTFPLIFSSFFLYTSFGVHSLRPPLPNPVTLLKYSVFTQQNLSARSLTSASGLLQFSRWDQAVLFLACDASELT